MKRGKWDIPDYELEAIVKCFLPDIQEFYATYEGKKYLEDTSRRKDGKHHHKPIKRLKTHARAGRKSSLPSCHISSIFYQSLSIRVLQF